MAFICPFHIWDVILPIEKSHGFPVFRWDPTGDMIQVGCYFLDLMGFNQEQWKKHGDI